LERWLGRRRLLWSAVTALGAGVIGLTAGRIAEVTVGSVLVMGIGGGLVLVTVQAVLADHHGELARLRSPRRTSPPASPTSR
jgi:MFS family permease